MISAITINTNSNPFKPTITATGSGIVLPYPLQSVCDSKEFISLTFSGDNSPSASALVRFVAVFGGVEIAKTDFALSGDVWQGTIRFSSDMLKGALIGRDNIVATGGFIVVDGDEIIQWQFPLQIGIGSFEKPSGAQDFVGEASEYAGEASEYAEQASEYAEQASEYAYNASEYAGEASEYAEQASEYAYNASEYAEQIGGRIDCLAEDVSRNAQDVSGLQGCVSGLQNTVSNLYGCVSGLRGCVGELRNNATELQVCLDTMNCQLFGTCGEFADVRAEISDVGLRVNNVCTKIGCVSNELHSNYQKKLVAGDGLYISECSTSASIGLCHTEMWCYDSEGGCVNLKLAEQPTGVKYEVNGNTFSAPVISAPLIRATRTSGTGWRADFHGGNGGFYVTASGETRFYGVVQLSPGYVEVRNRVLTALGGVNTNNLAVWGNGTISGTLSVNGSCFAKVNPCGVVFGFDDGGFFSDKKDCAGCRNRLFSRGGSDSTTKINCNIEVGESGYTLGQIINAMRQHNFL